MKNIQLKSLIPFISAIAIFIAITFIYFAPLLKGKVIQQSDMIASKGMSKEINDFRDKYHEEPLWTNSMFGGMPAYLISGQSKIGTLLPYVRTLLTLGMSGPAIILFSYMMGFFILLLVLRINPWLSIVGSIAFAFTSYTLIIIEAGHITKAMSISYMAPVFASVILICRKKYLLGTALLSLFMGLELYSSHVQIAYYLIMLLAIYVAFQYVGYVKAKEYDAIGKTILSFVIAGVIAFGCVASNLLNTMDYVKYTIRGKSELTDDASNKTSGLDRDYVVQWSMGKAETMSLMIPGFKGRSSGMQINENPGAVKEVDDNMKEYIGNMPQYWGDQPFTSARYAGAVVMFLFVLGLFIVDGGIKWSLLIASVLSMFLSWGKNFMFLTDLFLDYLPGYNKFRAVSMILVIAEFAIPLLAVLAVDKLLKTPDIINKKVRLAFVNKEITMQNVLIVSFALTGGLSLLYFFVPDLTTFTGASDDGIYQQVAQSNGAEIARTFMDNLEEARRALFKADAIRSFFFILLATVPVWLYMKLKINQTLLIVILGVLVLVDLWTVDKKFLNDKNFVNKQEATDPFPESVADKAILTDTDPDYRVLNLAVNTFNDASTSFRHKSIGGYHAAKLRRYQDLIERQIGPEIQNVIGTLRSANPTDSALRVAFSKSGVLNMLNARYIIYNPSSEPLRNRYALGNAWFVNTVLNVKNADEEIAALGKINPETTAIVDERFKGELQGFTIKPDYTATIKLTDYKPNHLTYEAKTSSEQLAVFSEIYYEDGWNAYVDGQLKPYFRTDYVLRAMRVPVGKHTIEFKFEPSKYHTRQEISFVSSLVLFGFLGFSIFKTIEQKE